MPASLDAPQRNLLRGSGLNTSTWIPGPVATRVGGRYAPVAVCCSLVLPIVRVLHLAIPEDWPMVVSALGTLARKNRGAQLWEGES